MTVMDSNEASEAPGTRVRVQDVFPCLFSYTDVFLFLRLSVLSCRVTCLSLDRLPICFCERVVYRHRALLHILLILRVRIGFNARRSRQHGS